MHKQPPSRLLLKAALGKGPTRGIPKSILRSLEVELDRVPVPKAPRAREKFLESFAGIFSNCNGQRMLGVVAKSARIHADALNSPYGTEIMLEPLRRALRESVEASMLALESSRPQAYMRFLARNGFRIPRFLQSAGGFARGEGLDIEAVPEEKMKRGVEIGRLVKDGSTDALRKLIPILQGIAKEQCHPEDHQEVVEFEQLQIVSQVALGLCKDNGAVISVLESDYPLLYKGFVDGLDEGTIPILEDMTGYTPLLDYGVYVYEGEPLLFDRRFANGALRGFYLCDWKFLWGLEAAGITTYDAGSGAIDAFLPPILEVGKAAISVTAHELLHMFDNLIALRGGQEDGEYRAYLFGLVTSAETDLDWEIGTVERMTGDCEPGDHRNAARRVVRGINRLLGEGSRELRAARYAAHALLNKAYKKACGLSYDEILEPFRK